MPLSFYMGSPSSVVPVETKLGTAYARRGYEGLEWNSIVPDGVFRMGRRTYSIWAHDSLPEWSAWTAPDAIRVVADPFPPTYPRPPPDTLDWLLDVDAHLRPTGTIVLPTYVGASRLPEDPDRYFLLWEYSALVPVSEINPTNALEWKVYERIGRGARSLHSLGLFHRSRFSIDYLLTPSKGTHANQPIVCPENWDIRETPLDSLQEQEIVDFIFSTLPPLTRDQAHAVLRKWEYIQTSAVQDLAAGYMEATPGDEGLNIYRHVCRDAEEWEDRI